MGRLAGDRAEATVTHNNLTSSNEKEGKKKEKSETERERASTPTFVCTRHPLQVICEGGLSANQVGEYPDLRREGR